MRALVLAGGGAKGSFQVGVLRGLLAKEPNLDYNIYTGVSVGAINAAALSCGKLSESLPNLEHLWLEEVKGNPSVWKSIFFPRMIWSGVGILATFTAMIVSMLLNAHLAISISLLLLFIASLSLPYFVFKNTKSIYSTDPLRGLVAKNLNMSKAIMLGKRVRVGATCYEDGKYRTANERSPNILEWVLGSASYPIFFPMQKIGGNHYADGGVREIAPLRDAIEMGATDIDVIIADPEGGSVETEVGDILSMAARFLTISSIEIIKDDLAACKNSNINVRVFAPDYIVNDNSLDFDAKKIRSAYEHGVEVGRR